MFRNISSFCIFAQLVRYLCESLDQLSQIIRTIHEDYMCTCSFQNNIQNYFVKYTIDMILFIWYLKIQLKNNSYLCRSYVKITLKIIQITPQVLFTYINRDYRFPNSQYSMNKNVSHGFDIFVLSNFAKIWVIFRASWQGLDCAYYFLLEY